MLKALKWPLVYVVMQFGLIFLFAIFYVVLGFDMANFTTFFNNYQIILVLILAVILLPCLVKEYKKRNNNPHSINVKTAISIFFFGIILSLVYNIFMFYVDKSFLSSGLFNANPHLVTTILSVGIIGPVMEELMFRGIMYHDLKEKFSNMQSILLCSIIFACFHVSFIQFIYAFAIGFLLIYVYEKYQTLKAPILLHIASNLTTTLFLPILIQNHFILNYSIYIVCLIILIIIFMRYRKSMIE